MDVIYPAVNGTNDLAFKKLNMSIRPVHPISNDTIKIMWSSTFEPRPKKTWTPNHFVPVVPETSTRACSLPEMNFSFMFQKRDMSTPIYKKQKPKVQIKETRTPPSSPVSIPSSPTVQSPHKPVAKTPVSISPPSSPFVPSVKKRQRTKSTSPSPNLKKPTKTTIANDNT